MILSENSLNSPKSSTFVRNSGPRNHLLSVIPLMNSLRNSDLFFKKSKVLPRFLNFSFWKRMSCHYHQVIIPKEDRFNPFALTIKRGDTVTWSNRNCDPHTITSLDPMNSTGPCKIDHVILPGEKYSIQFDQPGLWIYFCRYHAHLNEHCQPIAPGPGPNGNRPSGVVTPQFCAGCPPACIMANYGTPMMGIIAVMKRSKD